MAKGPFFWAAIVLQPEIFATIRCWLGNQTQDPCAWLRNTILCDPIRAGMIL